MADDPRKAASRVPLSELTLANVSSGLVEAGDLTIRRETLLEQARLADSQGYPELARNFRRAAELTAIPNDVLLETYDKLRPYRATYHHLLSISQEISARYDAPETGEYIRHAAEAYRAKGLLKPEDIS
jgi:propanediol dehydratase small subunit